MARTIAVSTLYPLPLSAGNTEFSIQAALLDHDILANDQAMCRHLAQLWQHASNVLVGIDERNDDGKVATGFDKMRRSYLAPPEKASDCMECNRTKYALFSQIFQNGTMHRS